MISNILCLALQATSKANEYMSMFSTILTKASLDNRVFPKGICLKCKNKVL